MVHGALTGDVVVASGLGRFSLEDGIVAFAGLMLVLLVAVRLKRGHDQKRRRAASTGFYDFDVAHYGHPSAGSSLMETPMNPAANSLAPSFVSPNRAGGSKTGPMAKGSGQSAPSPSAGQPLPRPVPAFDQAAAIETRPPVPAGPPSAPAGPPRLPIPSTPLVVPPPPPGSPDADSTGPPGSGGGSTGSLPLLVQPPPPGDSGGG